MSHDPQICVITETWLHDAIGDDEVAPPGYRLYRHDRGSRGGGVAVIKSRISLLLLTKYVIMKVYF